MSNLPRSIVKRDGREVPFDRSRIKSAIMKATVEAIGTEVISFELEKKIDKITDEVEGSLFRGYVSPVPAVEQIQDIVIDLLSGSGDKELVTIGKAYSAYREYRNRVRLRKTNVMRVLADSVGGNSEASDFRRENGNINADTPSGSMYKAGSGAMKDYYLNLDLPEEFASLHKKGMIHIHDLDYLRTAPNCLQISLRTLFEGSFFTGHGSIREPKGIEVAAQLAAIAIQSSQNDCFGGQSIPNFEYELAPFVKITFLKHLYAVMEDRDIPVLDGVKKKLLNYARTHSLLSTQGKEYVGKVFSGTVKPLEVLICMEKAEKRTITSVGQAMEAFVHNLNTMSSRAGAQVPFSSVNLGTGTEPEERLIIEKELDAIWAGLGHGETAIFPITIFRVKDGINGKPGDPNYDLYEKACRVSCKRLFPTYLFLDAPHNLQYFREGEPDTYVATMGMTTGDGVIKVRLNPDTEQPMTFKNFWDEMEKVDGNEVIQFDDITEYIDLTDKGIEILDSAEGKWVECKKVMRCKNPAANWLTINTAHNHMVTVTSDHPLFVKIAGVPAPFRMEAKNILTGMQLYAEVAVGVDDQGNPTHWDSVTGTTPLSTPTTIDYVGYDVETSSDRFDLNGIVSHNCRTRVIGNTYDPDHETTSRRGNLFFTTINLPYVALQAKRAGENFEDVLDSVIDTCFAQLMDRYEGLAKLHVYNLPFIMGEHLYMGSEKLERDDTIGEALKNGTLSIGFCGLGECLIVLYGGHHGQNKEIWQKGYDIVKHLRERCDDEAAMTQFNFSLIGTPAESTAGRFVKAIKKEFGDVHGVTDHEYLTNSHHIPVWYGISVKDKIDLEAPFHALENAGSISYIEFDGDPNMNPEAYMDILQYAKKSGISYFAINSAVDYDPVCGFVGIIGDTCPRCGRHTREALTEEQYNAIHGKYLKDINSIYGVTDEQ